MRHLLCVIVLCARYLANSLIKVYLQIGRDINLNTVSNGLPLLKIKILTETYTLTLLLLKGRKGHCTAFHRSATDTR